jgi:hypothetical protein
MNSNYEIIQIPVAESNPTYRRVFFQLQDGSGNPVATASGLQPSVSRNGDVPGTSGIAVLNPIAAASGLYYSTLNSDLLKQPGDILKSWVNSGTVVTYGSTIEVIPPRYASARNAYTHAYTQSGVANTITRRKAFMPNLAKSR